MTRDVADVGRWQSSASTGKLWGYGNDVDIVLL